MRVFMLGWEFPPFISGGLGTACYGLTRGLDEAGVDVCFVLPTAVPVAQVGGAPAPSHVELRTPADLPEPLAAEGDEPATENHKFKHIDFHRVDAALEPYGSPKDEDVDLDLERLQAQARAEAAELKRKEHPSGDPAKSRAVETAQKARQAQVPQMQLPQGSMVMGGAGEHYSGDLMSQIHRYTRLATQLAMAEEFDVIHAHDWMTYPAGLAVAAATGKPLVVHVHSTEFDRSGQNVNQHVYDIERAGMHQADCVVCVSHLTGRIAAVRYGVPDEKIEVVYNAVDLPSENGWSTKPIGRDEKIVLFLGRITMQKGPEYFLRAARKVVEKFKKVRFVMAGSGDMVQQCIREAADLQLGRYVTFTGFLRGGDVSRVFEMADLYVMPSVSEPFGIAPLEALSHNVPVIISRQSGVSEVLTHVLKVDFWDTDEMANKILAVLRHEPLGRTLRQQGQFELTKLSWEDSAAKLKGIYKKLISHGGKAV